MLKSSFGCCSGIRLKHWFFVCTFSVFVALPTTNDVRSFAEESPEKLGAEDISIGEPLQIPLHSEKEAISVEKGSKTKASEPASPEVLIPPKPNTTKSEDSDDKNLEKQSESVTVLPEEEGKTDDNSTKKNLLKKEFQLSVDFIARDFEFIGEPILLSLVGLSIFVGLIASYISTFQYLRLLNKN